jgi:hypothetical protein
MISQVTAACAGELNDLWWPEAQDAFARLLYSPSDAEFLNSGTWRPPPESATEVGANRRRLRNW